MTTNGEPGEETPPGGNGADDDDAYVASLSPRARTVLEGKNAEAAARRHETREATQAAEQARQALAQERERREALEREHEGDAERVIREAREAERAQLTGDFDRERASLTAEHRRELARLQIQAKAAGKFANPEDAVSLLPLSELLAEEDESRRETAIDGALDALLKAKPYLALQGPRQPLVTQGGRSERPNGRASERSWLRG